jgi:N-acetylneuraminic acid mutarotase
MERRCSNGIPRIDRWTIGPEVSHQHNQGAAVSINNRIMICGGFTCRNAITSHVKCLIHDDVLQMGSEGNLVE